jgi:hypothetical protein
MDVAVKSLPPSRAPTFLAVDVTVGARRRPTADERIDIPEVQQSARVTFSNGAVVHGWLATPSPTAMYRAIQDLA